MPASLDYSGPAPEPSLLPRRILRRGDGVVKNAAGVTLGEMVSPIIVRRRADAAAE